MKNGPIHALIVCAIPLATCPVTAAQNCRSIREIQPASLEAEGQSWVARARSGELELLQHGAAPAATEAPARALAWSGEGPLEIRNARTGRSCHLDGEGLTRVFRVEPSERLLIELGSASRLEGGSDSFFLDASTCRIEWRQKDHTPSEGRLKVLGPLRVRIEDHFVLCERPGKPTERCGTVRGATLAFSQDCRVRVQRPAPRSKAKPKARKSNSS